MQARLGSADAQEAIDELFAEEQLIALDDGEKNDRSNTLVIAAAQWTALSERTLQIVKDYHENFPLRRGIPREELKSRLKIDAKLFTAMLKKLIDVKTLVEAGKMIAMPRHSIRFDNGQQAKVEKLMRRFAQSPFSPPTIKESQSEVGEEIFNALIELGELISVSSEVVFRKNDYEKMIAMVREHIKNHDKITVAETRDLLSTTRRYVLALLENLDATSITRREGDYRVLKN